VLLILQACIFASVQHMDLDQYESNLAETIVGVVALSTCDS